MRTVAARAAQEVTAAASRRGPEDNMEIAGAFALWLLLSILGWSVVALLVKALAG